MENKNVKLIDKQVYEEEGLLYLSLTYEFKNIEGNNEICCSFVQFDHAAGKTDNHNLFFIYINKENYNSLI